MSRNIVEFGYSDHSTSLCREGDQLLGAEPLLSSYDYIYKPEGVSLDFFKVDEIAIAGHDGVCDIHFESNNLGSAFTPLSSAVWNPNESQKTLSIPCITLDTWLSRYGDQGFTERIDCMNCVLNGNTADAIFENFSFTPRPEVIIIRQHAFPELAFERMRQHGYKLYRSGDFGFSIHCGGILIGK